MRIFFALILLFLISCSKPDPNPELKDPIFADLEARLAETKKSVEETEKQLVENRKELDSTEPQTGKAKFAQKRYFETESKIAKLKQLAAWYAVEREERLKYARKKYIEAFNKKKEWPDKEEYEQYKKVLEKKSLRLEWDVKKRFKEAGLPIPGQKKIEKPAEEAKKKE